MKTYLNDKSLTKLATCCIKLNDVIYKLSKFIDFTVLCGYRDEATQNKAFEDGASTKQWPHSKHNTSPSIAIDVAPWPIPEKWGADDWKERVKFYELAAQIKYEALRQGVKIRWGGDWDGDGDYNDQTFDDLVHFEIIL